VRRESTCKICSQIAKTKCQPKAITLVRADREADKKRRPRLYTGKGEEKEK
jgi:hypothetical protein